MKREVTIDLVKSKITETWERISEANRQMTRVFGSHYMTEKAKNKYDAIWELYKCMDFANNLTELSHEIRESDADEEVKKYMKNYVKFNFGIEIL